MSESQIEEIQNRLDNYLFIDLFERDYRTTEEAATEFFQDLFVEVLNYEETPSPLGDANWQNLPVHDWPSSTRANAARLFAESGNFRVIYVELEKLTKTAERKVVQSLTRSERTSGWALSGSFLAVFHAPEGDVWHLVTPYEEESNDITEGRSVIRRYTIGEGETHHTVSEALSQMDAGKPGRLADRIDQAFRVQPVTENFYEDYKAVFETLTTDLRDKGLELEDADRYAHITLNRLMFFYYLQQKSWIGGRKDFIDWFHTRYGDSEDSDCFHEKWLGALFFEGMNNPEGNDVEASLPKDVTAAIACMPYMNGGLFEPENLDKSDVFLTDEVLHTAIQGFLEQYNFTITEESPYDIDVAVDPAMLGKIYESLIAEQERGEAGIFYTPRVEVDLMCRMALYEQFCDNAHDLDSDGKQQIVEFIFSEPQDWDPDGREEIDQLENILKGLRIVDPACGSGAFLVGMKQVLSELYRKLGTPPDYELKEQIINENLYGVDIKDWAVRVAEFRLWLSLVEAEESVPQKEPVLPNFSFKLRTGDSIVQEVGGKPVRISVIDQTTNDDIRRAITSLQNAKSAYFNGTLDDWEEFFELNHPNSEICAEEAINIKQQEITELYLDYRINVLEQRTSQATLGGGVKQTDDDIEIKAQLEQLRSAKTQITDSEEGLFLWEISYPEVMREGGFNIVIGNPPYVSSGDIINQSITQEVIDGFEQDTIDELQAEYRSSLQRYASGVHHLDNLSGKSDLYVYFFLKGLDLLAEGGTLTLVTSNSWMDAGFGKRLKQYVIRYYDFKHILSSEVQRSFVEADINTAISVINNTNGGVLRDFLQVTTLSTPYESVADPENLWDLVYSQDGFESYQFNDHPIALDDTPSHRAIAIPHITLWSIAGGQLNNFQMSQLNGDTSNSDKIIDSIKELKSVCGQLGLNDYRLLSATPEGNWESNPKWSAFVRAPTTFFEKIDVHLTTKLGDVANVHLGLTSGLNRYFYLDVADVSEYGIEEEYLRTLIKSPSEISRYRVNESDLSKRVLDVQEDLGKLPPDSNIKSYLNQGIDQGVPDRPFFNNIEGDEWYKKRMFDADLVQPYAVGKRHFTALNDTGACVDKRLVCIDAKSEREKWILWGYLNSTISILVKELFGKIALGQGALENSVTDSSALPIPDLSIFPDDVEDQIEQLSKDYSDAEIGTVFEEIADTPGQIDLGEISDFRRELDELVMGEVLGLNEQEQLMIYDTTVKLTFNRILKSTSV